MYKRRIEDIIKRTGPSPLKPRVLNSVNNMKNILVILVLLCLSAESSADQPRSSSLQIWAENDDVYVLHSHDLHAWEVNLSEVRIIRKVDGEEVFRSETAPFTKLVPVKGGKYFAGLSDLQAGTMPAGYNFALFTPEGQFLSKVYVSRETAYCERVQQSVSQNLNWFSRNPEVTLKWIDEDLESILVKPYYWGDEDCELPLGEHLIDRSSH